MNSTKQNSNNTKGINKITEQSRNFEVSIASIVKKSERRAWFVAVCSMILSILLGIGYLFVMPLKEKVPYLVIANPYTGSASVARLIADSQNDTITRSEAINKSNVANYVIARESYDWDLINRRDWNTVYAMSANNVAAEYKAIFTQNNPNNPDVIYGQKKSLRIKIKTIVLLGDDGEKGPTGATVRFDRLLIDRQNPRIESSDSQIATLAFEYHDNLNMREEYRIENPLGFRVISYRVDPENSNVNSTVLSTVDSLPTTQSSANPHSAIDTTASSVKPPVNNVPPVAQQSSGGGQ